MYRSQTETILLRFQPNRYSVNLLALTASSPSFVWSRRAQTTIHQAGIMRKGGKPLRDIRRRSYTPPPTPRTPSEIVKLKREEMAASVAGPTITMKCPRCVGVERTYSSEAAIVAHLKFKHPEVSQVETTAKIWIAEHLAAGPTPTKSSRCPECGTNFPTLFALESHMLAKHGVARPIREKPQTIRDQIRPRTVEVRIPVVPELVESVEAETVFEPPPPPPPASVSSSSSDTPAAPAPKKEKKIAVEHHRVVFVDEETLAKAPWWCNGCQRGFGGVQALLGHLTSRHGKQVAAARCPTCRREYGNSFMLRDHIELAHRHIDIDSLDIEGHSCDCSFCPRQFAFIEDLNAHVAVYHPEHAVKEIRMIPTPGQQEKMKDQAQKPAGDVINPDDVSFA